MCHSRGHPALLVSAHSSREMGLKAVLGWGKWRPRAFAQKHTCDSPRGPLEVKG